MVVGDRRSFVNRGWRSLRPWSKSFRWRPQAGCGGLGGQDAQHSQYAQQGEESMPMHSAANLLMTIVDALLCNMHGHVAHGFCLETKKDAVSLEGWSLLQWAEWGKKKSKIASHTSHINGELKQSIALLQRRIDELDAALMFAREGPQVSVDRTASMQTSSEISAAEDHLVRGDDATAKFGKTESESLAGADVKDPLVAADPWSGKTIGLPLSAPPSAFHDTGGADSGDAWSRYPFRDTSLATLNADAGVFVPDGVPTLDAPQGDAQCRGDWRCLPTPTWRAMNDRFPNSPYTMEPEKYVEERWPSYGVLLNAARHWRRYGSSATLPTDICNSVDVAGCNTELQDLRGIFAGAWAAGADRWRDRY